MASAELILTDQEERWLRGEHGRAMQLAMELIVSTARIAGVTELVAIEMAHINSCHYSGQLSLDFAEFLLAEGARLAVPTHTNASLIACSSPDVRPAAQAPVEVAGARRVMEIYEQLGCSTSWTCAPYQQPDSRPGFGDQVVGSESNAVSFFNSVIGARTNKYGDLLDISAAMVGRVPLTGLHTDGGRRATHVIRLDVSDAAQADPTFHHVLGIIMGRTTGSMVPVIDGMDLADEDQLKAIAAAGATAGSVDMFHVVGVTPEAPDLIAALQGQTPALETVIDDAQLMAVYAELSTRPAGPIDAVCLGTPHFSITEFQALIAALDGRMISPGVTCLVTTSRAVILELGLRGWAAALHDQGVRVVADTCTYYPPRPVGVEGTVMTNSAKWAYYAPGILGVDVTFGSLAQCVEAGIAGEVVL